MKWRWTKSEKLFFEILRIKCSVTVSMHDIDWILDFHFYTDISKFSTDLYITQFQNQNKNKSVKISILFDSFMFTSTEQKYFTYKRELCTMIWFCTKYAYMLKSSAFSEIIHMNHKSLVQFLTSDLHDSIYNYWAVKMRKLSLEIKHIFELKNKMTDELSRTLFNNFNCHMNIVSKTVQQELEKKNSQWIGKNDKEDFTEFLNMLIQNQSLEIIKHRILHDILIHAIHVSELIISEIAQSAETIWSAAFQFSNSISWKIIYQKFL